VQTVPDTHVHKAPHGAHPPYSRNGFPFPLAPAQVLLRGVRLGVLSRDHVLPNVFFLAAAGYETTCALIGSTILSLLEMPDLVPLASASPNGTWYMGVGGEGGV
jgi:hypothetical protein